ncbi:MAG TPA: hypothetical protein PLI19_00940 [Erysipelotrichaceae bacterium]|nr:hypothetical protein [Erysipelotrichaceae bacterium]
MRKALKVALEVEQIAAKNKYDIIDAYEIHLYGDERDNFSLYHLLNKPVLTVHYPLKRCDIVQVARERNTEYFKKVVDFCKEINAGLVIHADSPSFDVFNNPDVEAFCKIIRRKKIILYVENCYLHIGAKEGLNIIKYLKNRIGERYVYPLLDTCHLMMSSMSFKYEENSFFQTMDDYKSRHFIMHLNDSIGSGEKETGGIHGTNFSRNSYLLNNILWKIYNYEKEGYKVDCVLEINEEDYINVPDAMELARNIDIFWNDYIMQELDEY